jgi:hypothetical protein
MSEMQTWDIPALLVGGVLPAGPRVMLRRLGHSVAHVQSHGGSVESVTDVVQLRFLIPEDGGGDVMRLALGLMPGEYRVGQLLIGGRLVTDLGARLWEASDQRPTRDGWIHLRWRSDTKGPELDVRGLFQDEAVDVRLTVARIEEESKSAPANSLELARTLSRAQRPLADAFSGLIQDVHALRGAINIETARLVEALAHHDVRNEERMRVGLEGLQTSLDRIERAQAETFWRRLWSRLRGAR